MRIKDRIRGAGKVYRFTLTRLIKGKTSLLILLCLLLFAAVSVPVMTYLMGGKAAASAGPSEQTEFAGEQTTAETLYKELGISREQAEMLNSPYEVRTGTVAEYFEPEKVEYSVRYGLQVIYCIVVMMLASFTVSYVIDRVIEEKASKLSEFLMVSIQPLALLLGKILAVMTFVFFSMLSACAVFALSFLITGQFMDTAVIARWLASLGITSELFRLSPLTAAVIVVSLILSYAMISLLSGLLGAGCSAAEDAQPASVVAVLLITAGYAIANSTVQFDHPAATALLCLIPVVSMYTMPMRYLTGGIGIWMVGLSWLIEALTIAFLAYMCAKIYRDLMLYRGSRIKIGGLFSMLYKSRREKGARV